MKSYIKCVDVDYESSRIEDFNGIYYFIICVYLKLNSLTDISLNVKGMKNLQESFREKPH